MLGTIILGYAPLFVTVMSLGQGILAGVLASLVLWAIVLSVYLLRNLIPYKLRLLFLVLLTGSVAVFLALVLQVFYYDLFMMLGVFLPLVSVNVLVFFVAGELAFVMPFKALLKKTLLYTVLIIFMLAAVGLCRELLVGRLSIELMQMLTLENMLGLQGLGLGIFNSNIGMFFILALFAVLVNAINHNRPK